MTDHSKKIDKIIASHPQTPESLIMVLQDIQREFNYLPADALLMTAEALGVKDQLFKQWQIFGPDFAEQSGKRVQGVTAKAWRFAGEMEEIAATFRSGEIPDGFHLAAAEIYRRMAGLKGRSPLDSDTILRTLVAEAPG